MAAAQEKAMTEQPPKKYSQLLQSRPVTIVVGPPGAAQTFYVHKALLTTNSMFFNRALNGHFQETQSQEVELPDENPQLFGAYVKYLYDERQELSLEVNHTRATDCVALAMLYVLGDKLGSPSLQWRVLVEFREDFVAFQEMPHDALVKLLQICTEQVCDEDPMQAIIYAAVYMKSISSEAAPQLRKYGPFMMYMHRHPGLSARLKRIGTDLDLELVNNIPAVLEMLDNNTRYNALKEQVRIRTLLPEGLGVFMQDDEW